MQFEVNQGRLLAALIRAQSVADHRVSPVLANVLIEMRAGVLRCRSTDHVVALTELVPAQPEIGSPDGSIAVKAKDLAQVVRAMPSGPILVKTLDKSWLELKASRSEVKMMGMMAGDFPDLPDPDKAVFVDFKAQLLIDLIDKTVFSVSTDEARVNINGALLESDGETMTMVSTDGHRLTRCTVAVAGPRLAAPVVIPRAGLLELKKVAHTVEGDCRLAIGDRFLFLRAGEALLSVKLNNVTFPPWRQVTPASHTSSAQVNRGTLLAALRQAVVVAPSKTSTTTLVAKENEIQLRAANPEFGEVELSVEAEYDGDPIEMGLNGNYVIELLMACDSEFVEIRFQQSLDPIVVIPVGAEQVEDSTLIDLLGLCMPMRI